MNRTSIGWCDLSWNPITGCSRRCKLPKSDKIFCYAYQMAQRLRGRFGYPEDDPFKVTFHPDRLHEPSQVKKPLKIFVCSMGEFNDPSITQLLRHEWLKQIFDEMKRNPQHTFQMLTQRTLNLLEYSFPKNCWVGATVRQNEETYRISTLVAYVWDNLRFASFEPLLEKIDVRGKLGGLDWVIIGALTGHKQPDFEDEWVDVIVREAKRYGIPVFMKNNLIGRYHGKYWMQEFPPKVKPIPRIRTH